MQSASDIAIAVYCNNIVEASAAMEAIRAVRRGEHPSLDKKVVDGANNAEIALSSRIEFALTKAPLKRPREIVLEQLSATTPGAWLPYPNLQAAFEEEGLKKEQAQAALRDLSWQMNEYLPPEDTVGVARGIEVLAERFRSGGEYQYRLTPAGRIAVERFLNRSKSLIGN